MRSPKGESIRTGFETPLSGLGGKEAVSQLGGASLFRFLESVEWSGFVVSRFCDVFSGVSPALPFGKRGEWSGRRWPPAKVRAEGGEATRRRRQGDRAKARGGGRARATLPFFDLLKGSFGNGSS